jgi:hypothetical protein
MAAIKNILILLCFLCGWSLAIGQPVLKDQPLLYKSIVLRNELIAVAESQLHVREKTGKNDGKDVRKYLREVGLTEGYPWCAAYVAWCHNQLNIPNPESAWSPDWFRANVVYRRNDPGLISFQSRPGQVFGLYYESKKRVAHVGIITGETRFHYQTIEGNTNAAGSNEGDGVYRKIRKKESIFVISDYAGYHEIREAMKK